MHTIFIKNISWNREFLLFALALVLFWFILFCSVAYFGFQTNLTKDWSYSIVQNACKYLHYTRYTWSPNEHRTFQGRRRDGDHDISTQLRSLKSVNLRYFCKGQNLAQCSGNILLELILACYPSFANP